MNTVYASCCSISIIHTYVLVEQYKCMSVKSTVHRCTFPAAHTNVLCLLTLNREPITNKISYTTKSNLVSHGFYWGLLQEYRQGAVYSNRNDTKTAASPNPTSSWVKAGNPRSITQLSKVESVLSSDSLF